ncbi:MAG TPA: hypothetical protein VFK73_01690 [Paludibacter sp.]|nr:hypothetical protein [Paludibacter sp.]
MQGLAVCGDGADKCFVFVSFIKRFLPLVGMTTPADSKSSPKTDTQGSMVCGDGARNPLLYKSTNGFAVVQRVILNKAPLSFRSAAVV